MLSPKKTKFKKQQRGRLKGKASSGNTINFGDYAIQALEPTWLTSRQIEATRRTITRYTKRGGKLWITVFPDKPITARAAESRMGSGKGALDYWVAKVKPGTILFELSGVNPTLAKEAMKIASYKLPIKTKFITKQKID
uniref:Large ribosomal subunit protein uL16c n=1 Tax=Dictyopteris divaricata TaxID=156996 RepID=A0A2I4Q2I6_9PHAE|nr:50S ribosomal protein L16 [Dictyopteris divaricata]YP_010205338.1 50S ribosomal protein L16 [Grateloupia livida]AQZ25049.1 50S ribosomal protein L16 [Dictyopteris divaricata]UAV85907.1 50S ribosomal protein L16 [Grateloupia livida]